MLGFPGQKKNITQDGGAARLYTLVLHWFNLFCITFDELDLSLVVLFYSFGGIGVIGCMLFTLKRLIVWRDYDLLAWIFLHSYKGLSGAQLEVVFLCTFLIRGVSLPPLALEDPPFLPFSSPLLLLFSLGALLLASLHTLDFVNWLWNYWIGLLCSSNEVGIMALFFRVYLTVLNWCLVNFLEAGLWYAFLYSFLDRSLSWPSDLLWNCLLLSVVIEMFGMYLGIFRRSRGLFCTVGLLWKLVYLYGPRELDVEYVKDLEQVYSKIWQIRSTWLISGTSKSILGNDSKMLGKWYNKDLHWRNNGAEEGRTMAQSMAQRRKVNGTTLAEQGHGQRHSMARILVQQGLDIGIAWLGHWHI